MARVEESTPCSRHRRGLIRNNTQNLKIQRRLFVLLFELFIHGAEHILVDETPIMMLTVVELFKAQSTHGPYILLGI